MLQQEIAAKAAPAGGSSESELEKKRKDAEDLLRDLGVPDTGILCSFQGVLGGTLPPK